MGFWHGVKELGSGLAFGLSAVKLGKEYGSTIASSLRLHDPELDFNFVSCKETTNNDALVFRTSVVDLDKKMSQLNQRELVARSTFGWCRFMNEMYPLVVVAAKDSRKSILSMFAWMIDYEEDLSSVAAFEHAVRFANSDGCLVRGHVVCGEEDFNGYAFGPVMCSGRTFQPVINHLAGVQTKTTLSTSHYVSQYEGAFLDPNGPSAELGGWLIRG